MSGPVEHGDLEVRRARGPDIAAVADLVNSACRGTWEFRPLSVTPEGELAGEAHAPDCLFVGVRGSRVVSAAYGWTDSQEHAGVVLCACAAPTDGGRLLTVPPLLACVRHMRSLGARTIKVERWHDAPYSRLLVAVEGAGCRWRHGSVILRKPLRSRPCAVAPPEGYAIRQYRLGDERAWADLRGQIFGQRPNPDEFWDQKYMGVNMERDFAPEAFLFAVQGDRPVGLSGGIICHGRAAVQGRPVGVVAWTGVLSAHRRKGLGKALVCAGLSRVWGEGARVCDVQTQFYRAPAVNMYRAMGFRFQQASLTIT